MSRLLQALFLALVVANLGPTFFPEVVMMGKGILCKSGEVLSIEHNTPVCTGSDGAVAIESTGKIPWWIGGITFVGAYGVLGLFRRRQFSEGTERSPQSEVDLSSVQISDTDKAEIQRMVREGNIIHAIKKTRELTGLGLKEAKDLVDGRLTGKVVQLPSATGFSGTVPPKSSVESLESLKEMLDKGLVSQVEFETKKKEILSRM